VPLPTSSPGTRAPRTFAPTPFDEGAVHHVETVRAFVDAYDAGRYDDAIAFIDERILFSGDCDYGSQKLYSISDHESATYWLRSRIADHDRIDIVQFVDLQDGEFKRMFAGLLEDTRVSVTLVGKYKPENLGELMREIDWVIVPSIWWENSPLVIQEAFMNGRPVICSNVGGMAEKVTDGVNGMHFQVGDPASLAATIRRAVQSSGTWDQMRQGIPPIYRLDHQVSELVDLYRQLIAGRPAGSQVNAVV